MYKFNLSEAQLSALTAKQILCGDLGEPESFLDDACLESVTYVVNYTAAVSFGNNPLLSKVNVESTLSCARLGRIPSCPETPNSVELPSTLSLIPTPNRPLNS